MKYLIALALTLSCGIAYAGQKVYYDPVENKQVIDVSGEKSKEDICPSCQEITIDEKKEAVRIANGKIVKYDYIKENEQIRKSEKQEKKTKEEEIKTKLSLTEQDWQNLKEALRD